MEGAGAEEGYTISHDRLPWNWIQLIGKCFMELGSVPSHMVALAESKSYTLVPPPHSCLLSWLNIPGSSIRASWTGVATHHFPCLSLSSAVRVGDGPVQTPKTGASLADDLALSGGVLER